VTGSTGMPRSEAEFLLYQTEDGRTRVDVLQREGEREVKREVEYYNLDVIISVGYRVKSYETREGLTILTL